MAAATPSYLTRSQEGSQGDREFIFSCKGRPFSVLTAPNFPTPPSTMVDYNLVRDLKLRITDLQCAKLVYAGHKFRILGRVSTSVQCISNGAPAGNTHFKAIVVQDLYQNLDTHSIAGQKLSSKLIGPPYELLSEQENKNLTEPTIAKKIQKSSEPPKTKRRKKIKTVPSESTSESESSPPITLYSAGQCTYFYEDDTADEYHDIYTNVSTVQYFGETKDICEPVTLSNTKGRMKNNVFTSAAPSANGDWVLPAKRPTSTAKRSTSTAKRSDSIAKRFISTAKPQQRSAPPNSFGPASAKLFTAAQLRRKRQQFRSGQSAPDLQHVPVPHGADWCDVRCLDEGEDLHGEELPQECGYHPRFGDIIHCSDRCPGGWCQHTRQMDGRDFMS